jgi:hypothetical protein
MSVFAMACQEDRAMTDLNTFDQMMCILQQIRHGIPNTRSDLIPVVGIEVRDAFLKIGIMLCVAAAVPEERLVAFTREFYLAQRRMQDLE